MCIGMTPVSSQKINVEQLEILTVLLGWLREVPCQM
jgi:hypothetical protein